MGFFTDNENAVGWNFVRGNLHIWPYDMKIELLLNLIL